MKLVYSILSLLFFITINASAIFKPSYVELGDQDHFYLRDFMAGQNNLIYLQTDNGVYSREGLDGEWELIFNFPDKSKFSKFYRNDSSVVHFVYNNTLFRIDPETSKVSRKLYVGELTNIIFHREGTFVAGSGIIMEFDNSNNLVNTVNFEEYNHSNNVDLINEYAYIPKIGRIITRQLKLGSEYIWAYVSNGDDENYTKLDKIKDSEGDIISLKNLTNSISSIDSYDSTTHQHYKYFYDTKSEDFIKLNTITDIDYSYINFSTVENYSVLYQKIYYPDQGYPFYIREKNGSEWTGLNLGAEYISNVSVSENGILYYSFNGGGLESYNINTGEQKYIDLPPAFRIEVKTKCKDFYRVANELWCLWQNEYIMFSQDDGSLWHVVDRPTDSKKAETFYIDDARKLYYICDTGIYTKELGKDWVQLDDLDLDSYDELNVIDVNADRILFAGKSENSSVYETWSYTYAKQITEKLEYDHLYLQKQLNGNFLYIPEEDSTKIVELDQNLKTKNTIILSEPLSINKVLLDSKNSIFAATNVGLFKAETWNDDFYKYDTISKPAVEMQINKNDSLFVQFEDYYGMGKDVVRLYGLGSFNNTWANNGSLVFLDNKRLWNTAGKSYSTLSYLDLEYTYTPNEDLPIKLEYSTRVIRFGETRDIKIKSDNVSDFSVRVTDFVNNKDTVIQAIGNEVIYVASYNDYHLTHCSFQAFKGDSKSSEREVEIKHVGYQEKNIKSYSWIYHTSQTKSQAAIYFYYSIEDGGLIGTGEITVTDPFTKEETTIEQIHQSDEVGYYFDVPIDTKTGLYRYYFRGTRVDGVEVATRYQYFVVLNDTETSVEEQNSIITNTNVYPNPAVSSVDVKFEMKEAGDLTCDIYDLNGNKVLSIPTSGYYAAGQSNLSFDISELVSGQYIIFLKAQDKVTAAKLVISK